MCRQTRYTSSPAIYSSSSTSLLHPASCTLRPAPYSRQHTRTHTLRPSVLPGDFICIADGWESVRAGTRMQAPFHWSRLRARRRQGGPAILPDLLPAPHPLSTAGRPLSSTYFSVCIIHFGDTATTLRLHSRTAAGPQQVRAASPRPSPSQSWWTPSAPPPTEALVCSVRRALPAALQPGLCQELGWGLPCAPCMTTGGMLPMPP